ncbi:MAG TPA: ABC transporter ATP-binding protein [Candidatus Eisenbacteria bacterium]|jgi:ABC-2 type transport system ATP-binding protein|nr:ABC transporter ATP-binding protein [Candidatus Eisenbacteria bacterium]
MKNAALDLRTVSKTFGAKSAVAGLSLSVGEGEMYGLIGPNGSGKTTTMKMIAGIYRPTSGAIKVRGVDALATPTKAKRMLGYVPDDPAAYDLLTGREFLQFVGELYGMPRPERDARIASLLASYRLEPVADGLFMHYSRGTKQKLSIAAALLHRPSVLLIDEPMVGLDPESAKVTKVLLTDFVRQGGAVLLSTHTLSVADEICDRFGILKEGRLVAEGTHAELSAKAGRLGSLEEVYLALTGGL